MRSKEYYLTLFDDIKQSDVENVKFVLFDYYDFKLKEITYSSNEPISINIELANLFKELLENKPSKIVVAHNHPGEYFLDGFDFTIYPSPADIATFCFLQKIFDSLNIELIDNYIFSNSREKYWSQKETDDDIVNTIYSTCFTREGQRKLFFYRLFSSPSLDNLISAKELFSMNSSKEFKECMEALKL